MNAEKIIEVMKVDKKIRERIIEWCNTINVMSIIQEWKDRFWKYKSYDHLTIEIPDGHHWNVVCSNRYYLDLECFDFNDNPRYYTMNVVFESTPTYGEIVEIRFDEIKK